MAERAPQTEVTRIWPAAVAFSGRPRLALLVWAPTGISEFEIPESGTIQVGRSTSCGIPIADSSVSRAHAEIAVDSEGLKVKDLGSRNGTFVNDRRLGAEPTRLRAGDFLRFGSAHAQLQLWTRPSARSVGPLPEESFLSRLMSEGERCVRLNSSISVISLELPGQIASNENAIDLKQLVREAVRATDVVSVGNRQQMEALLPECGKKAASAAAQRIQQSLESRGIKVRLGVAAYPGDAPSPESLPMAAQMAIRKVSGTGLALANEATRVLQIGTREVVVADPAMARLFGLVERIASASLPVLIHGETGCGKEIVADAIHWMGPRSAKPMVKLNCAAVPENLLESELFGYEKGAFSGATVSKPGLIEQASGGTLFLDEIAEMPMTLQAKLLRALEEQTLRRLGSVKDVPVDLRIVAATHRRLDVRVKEGLFREDLLYRLNTFPLEVPPLRERHGEIPLLAARFVTEECRSAGRGIATLTDEVISALNTYSWPGNIRELRSVIRRAVVLAESEITLEHLPPEIVGPKISKEPLASASDEKTLKDQLKDVERRRILDALVAARGNQTKAAQILKIARRTLVSKMNLLGIENPRDPRARSPSK